jgi:hypothetical protein
MNGPMRKCRECGFTEPVAQNVTCTFVEADLCGKCAKCGVCGCTGTTPCSTPHGPCYWVEGNLCSACVKPRKISIDPLDLVALETLPPIPVTLDGVTALFIMSALQLACRHPGVTGPIHETVYDFARGLQERISITPSLAIMCEAGWEPANDVPNEPEPQQPSRIILPGDPEFGI